MGRPAKTDDEIAFGRELGQALQKQRQLNNLTGEQLAHSSRVSVDQIRSIERGKAASPGIYSLACLASALGVSIDAITPAPRARS